MYYKITINKFLVFAIKNNTFGFACLLIYFIETYYIWKYKINIRGNNDGWTKQELIKRYLLITQYIQHRLNSYKRLIEKRNENGLLTIYAPTFFSELDKWLSELKNDKDEISNYENDDNNTIKVLHNLIEEGMKLFLDCKQKISNEQIKIFMKIMVNHSLQIIIT